MGLIRHHHSDNKGIHQLIKEFKVATQAEVDALTGEVTQIKNNLATARANIEERFALLEKELGEGKKGTEVDITGLKTAVADLGTPTQELEDLQPIAAAPPPPSTAAPTKADGTAVENTTDPTKAAEQAGQEPPALTPEQEAAARANV
jgi:hypothetical protein